MGIGEVSRKSKGAANKRQSAISDGLALPKDRQKSVAPTTAPIREAIRPAHVPQGASVGHEAAFDKGSGDEEAPDLSNVRKSPKGRVSAAEEAAGVAVATLARPPASDDPMGSLVAFLRAPCRNSLELAKRVTAYIAVAFAARPTAEETPEQRSRDVSEILASEWASCGDRDHFIGVLLARLGLRTRRIGFINVPFQGSHTATEILVDGRWRMMDATTGIYFSRIGDDDPLALSEARMLYPNVQMWRTRATAMSGWQGPSLDVGWRAALFGPIYDEHGFVYCLPKETYFLSASTGAQTIAYDEYELALDLDEAAVHTLGNPTNPSSISSPLLARDGTKLTSMLERIGRFGDGNVRHSFHMLARSHRRVQMTVALRPGQEASALDASIIHMVTPEMLDPPFPEARIIGRYSGKGSEVAVFEFHALAPLTKVALTAPWDFEGEVRFYGFQSSAGGRATR